MEATTITIIVDFDHTLFDTEALLERAQLVAKEYGIPKSDFKRTFEEITDGRQDSAYTFDDHIETLSYAFSFDKEALSHDFNRLIASSHDFLYKDSIPFLQNLMKWNSDIHLVTFANRNMRLTQIENSLIRQLVDHVEIVSASRMSKVESILRISSSSYMCVVFDDHPQILRYLVGNVTLPVRIRRKIYRRYQGKEPPLYGVPVFRDLTSAYFHLEPFLRSFGMKRDRNQ